MAYTNTGASHHSRARHWCCSPPNACRSIVMSTHVSLQEAIARVKPGAFSRRSTGFCRHAASHRRRIPTHRGRWAQPHCGENGLISFRHTEDDRFIAPQWPRPRPRYRRLRSVPPGTVFHHRAYSGAFDPRRRAVSRPGPRIPVSSSPSRQRRQHLAFGLPIDRTSVDTAPPSALPGQQANPRST